MEPKVSVIVPVYNVENYIERMLLSVKNQSFQDFEVVIINDGSLDNSEEIIKKMAKKDHRIKLFSKENGGVASARNMGIDKAVGKYVVFYDPDDFIPHNAIKKMYNVACAREADIVVGVMEEKNLGESMVYMHSQKLAKKKIIKPTDVHFFGAWSLCHKMFSLEFIRENKLKIEDVKNAEDGVFTFSALNCTEKIYGCNVIAYNYLKRPFWLTPSATQNISIEYLLNVLKAHKRILEEAEILADKYFDNPEKKDYLQGLYARFLDIEIINGYYRNLWRGEESLLEVLKEYFEEYRKHIDIKSWEEIKKKNIDLDLEKGLVDLETLKNNPKVSFIFSTNLKEEKLKLTMDSIYNQGFPSFEILMPKECSKYLEGACNGKANISMIDHEENPIEKAKGEYILFINEPVMFTRQSIRLMVNKLSENEDLDFVTMLLKSFNGEEFTEIKAFVAAYGYTFYGKKSHGPLTLRDTFMSNKLIRKASIENFIVSGYMEIDAEKLYKEFSFEKLKKGLMITEEKKEYNLQGTGIMFLVNYKKNKLIKNAIEKLKRYITREDINNLKKKFGR